MASPSDREVGSAAPLPDLSQCEAEPIHVPGSIQPHGALLVLHGATLRVTQATASCEALLGRAVSEVLERDLSTSFGPALADAVLDALERYRTQPDSSASFAWKSPVSETPFSGYVHECSPLIVLELEPTPGDATTPGDALAQAARASRVIRGQPELEAKAQTAAEWIRRLTGYDRVMVYRFHEDWHGEIIAEARRADLEPYLGLHYPAPDIPAQARRLYLVSPTRVIVDVDYTPSPLLPAVNPVTGKPLDLTLSLLRSVSPVHLEYLRNMGVGATLVASLLCDGALWGLISCHHFSPRPVSNGTREIADWMAQDLATQIATAEGSRSRRYAAHLKQCRDDVVHAMRRGARLPDLLRGPGLANLLGAVGAEGAALVQGADVIAGGVTPDPARILEICDRMSAVHANEPANSFVTDCLSEHLPEAADLSASAAGFGMFPLDTTESIKLVWFRGERLRSVTWGGNPDKAMNLSANGRVSPRQSFAAWTESVRGRSAAFRREDVDSARELGSMIDLELRRIAEDALRSSEFLLRDVTDSLTAHIAVLDSLGIIRSVNRAWRQFAERNGGGIGCQPGAGYLAECSKAVAGPSGGEALAALQGIRQVLSGERDYYGQEYPCDSPTEARWFVMRVFRLGGANEGAVIAHEDITASRLAQVALQRSEARFRGLFEGHSAVMLLVDPDDGTIVDVNPAAASFYGYPRELLRSMFIGSLNVLPREHLLRSMASAAKTEQNSFVFPHRVADGAVRTVEVSSSPVEVEGRALLFSIVHDVTERERSKEAIVRERLRYRSLMQIAQDGIHLLDADGTLLEANETFLRMLGRAPEEVGALRVSDWDASIPGVELGVRVRALLERPGLFRTRHRRKDGSVFDAEVHAGAVEIEGRRLLLASSRDITARVELERRLASKTEQLEQLNRSLEGRIQGAVSELRTKDQLLVVQGRQAAMGEMIGNIAHQWRQPLNALGLVLANLDDSARFGELDRATVEGAVADGTRLIQKMSTTINDFRDFFRPEKEKRAFSALAQIRETCALLDASFRNADIALEVESDADLTLFGFANEYSQVLLNLLSNARQAIVGAATPRGRVTIRLDLDDGLGRLRVSDNGGGVPATILDKIFEPYFSTKEGGTGIGLYMSRQIVERSLGGRIGGANVDGGAEFDVLVPLALERVGAPAEEGRPR
jgi:PAS domain S-box-containing protein